MAKVGAKARTKRGKRKVRATSAAKPKSQALPQGAADTPVLDQSNAGRPVLSGNIPVVAGESPEASAGEKLVIDIQLAPTAISLRAALAGNTAAFLAAAEGTSAPSEAGLAAVLRDFGLVEARALHDDGQIQEEANQIAALRQAAAVGAATQEQIAALEQLPSKASLVRLWFPPGTSVSKVKAALRQLPQIDKAEWLPSASPPMALAVPQPTDPLIGTSAGSIMADAITGLETQWYLHRTRVLQAWRYSRGGNVVIADVDWGYRISHQEFAGAIEQTYNAFSGRNDVGNGPEAAHGTAVLGIAGARANGVGIAGYAPESALWAIQADSSSAPKAFLEPWAEAIDFVRRMDSGGRRKVIILEVQTSPALGNYEQVLPVHRAIRAAIADGCVVCVAAGNGNRPADRNDLGETFDPTGSILVGATAYHETQNKRAFFSNYGSRVVVSAPGDPDHDLTCAQLGDIAYRNGFGGTSGATPKVAGVVALMLSVNPDLKHADVREILAGTGSPLTEDPGKPIGVFLNAEAAVAEALRRRTESAPGEAMVAPDGKPSPEVTAAKPLQGVRRRSGQLVLPDEIKGPISWDAAPEVGPQTPAHGLETSEVAAAPPGEQPPANDKTLQHFRSSVEGTLTQQDRILIVDQAIHMLDSFYVHRPLKEAIHAVRPIQRLRVLLRRMQQSANIPVEEKDELIFHNTLTEIFNSVRDLHTNYLLPGPYRNYIAYLPFEVAPFFEDDRRRYLVTRVMPNYTFAHSEFGPGAEIIYWAGMTIERAVRRTSDQTAGSNEAARHARGVSALTIRPMNTVLPPDADFVDLEFLPPGIKDTSVLSQMRQHWFVRYAPDKPSAAASAVSSGPIAAPPLAGARLSSAPQATLAAHSSLDLGRESTARSSEIIYEGLSPGPSAAPTSPIQTDTQPTSAKARSLGLAAALGLDTSADAVREARQLIFDPDSLRTAQRANLGDEVSGMRGSASPGTVSETIGGTEIPVRVPWNAAFRARTVNVAGRVYGHIHIRTFNVEDADGFVQEFIRLAGQVPEDGLILDVRGNGGGNIWASERLLQTLSPVEIIPERMQFLATPGTLDLCRNNPATSPIPLELWRQSLEEAVETASVYSYAFPLTDEQSCNAIGQRYYGPVVLLVDGNCYSATDIFAAGFQDHLIGQVIGVSNNTGAGGANVWEHWLLTEALPSGWGLKPLPNQAGMRVAIRQCLRVGTKAGALLEDFGVVPNEIYKLQREDLMQGDSALLSFAAKLLSKKKARSIKIVGSAPGSISTKRQITIRTNGLDRLDFIINDRPQGSIDLPTNAAGEATVNPQVDLGVKLKLLGYLSKGDRPVALYRGSV